MLYSLFVSYQNKNDFLTFLNDLFRHLLKISATYDVRVKKTKATEAESFRTSCCTEVIVAGSDPSQDLFHNDRNSIPQPNNTQNHP